MPQKSGSKLPNRGDWLISNALTGKNAPISSFAITFAQNSAGRANGTCTYWKTTAPLTSITETEVDTFLAYYAINGERGSFEAKYDPLHQTFDVKFLGRKTQLFSDGDTFIARSTSIELNTHSVASWTPEERLQEAVRRALPLMPSDVAEEVSAMLTPKAIAFMATATLIWGAAQIYGGPVALIVDILLLLVGVVALGAQIYDVANDIVDFAAARQAQSDEELDKSAAALAKAISIVGVNTIAMILFAKAPKVMQEGPYKPRSMPVEGRPVMGPTVTPSAEIRSAQAAMRARTNSRGWLLDTDAIQVDFNADLPKGVHGTTDVASGQIKISRALKGDAIGQTRALRHEQVHQFITKLASISDITMDLRVWAYEKSFVLRYLEEAIAELNAHAIGGDGILAAFHFPIKNGYLEVRNASSRLVRKLLSGGITEENINAGRWRLALSELDTKINAIERNGGRFLNQTELQQSYARKAELEKLLAPLDDLISGFIRVKGNGLRLKSYGRADALANEAVGAVLGEINVAGNFYRVFFSVNRPESTDPVPFSQETPAALPR